MVERMPWFKFWASEFLTDPVIDGMPGDATVLMLKMRCICSLEGSCPADPSEIARKTRTREAGVLSNIEFAKRFFEQRGDRFFDTRLEKEKLRAEHGRKGAAIVNGKRAKTTTAAQTGGVTGSDTASKGIGDTAAQKLEVRSKNLDVRSHRNPPNPLLQRGNLKIPTRKRDQLLIDQEVRRLVGEHSTGDPQAIVTQAVRNLGYDPQYVNYMGGSDCPFHPEPRLTESGNCWSCYSECYESGCQSA